MSKPMKLFCTVLFRKITWEDEMEGGEFFLSASFFKDNNLYRNFHDFLSYTALCCVFCMSKTWHKVTFQFSHSCFPVFILIFQESRHPLYQSSGVKDGERRSRYCPSAWCFGLYHHHFFSIGRCCHHGKCFSWSFLPEFLNLMLNRIAFSFWNPLKGLYRKISRLLSTWIEVK